MVVKSLLNVSSELRYHLSAGCEDFADKVILRDHKDPYIDGTVNVMVYFSFMGRAAFVSFVVLEYLIDFYPRVSAEVIRSEALEHIERFKDMNRGDDLSVAINREAVMVDENKALNSKLDNHNHSIDKLKRNIKERINNLN